MTTLTELLDSLPEYAKDIKLNLSSLINNHSLLSEQQFYGTLLAAAFASRNQQLTAIITNETHKVLNDVAVAAVKASATIMAMTNIYYRFTDLVGDEEYSKMPSGLRMNVMRETLVDKADFELWSLAVSIINGCSMCVSSHEKQLIAKHGVSREVIQLVAKIVATVHALARTQETMD